MKLSPKVTVYIPVEKKYEKYLPDAIISLEKQSFQNFKILILPENQETPKGLNRLANEAIKKASGEYIIRLDADDWLEPLALEKMVKWLEENKSHQFVYPDYYVTNENGKVINQVRRERDRILLDVPCLGACTMIRKSFFQEIGGYNESVDCQDGYDFWIKVIGESSKNYKWGHIHDYLFYYRKHGESLSDNKVRILKARRKIKLDFYTKYFKNESVFCILPIRYNEYKKIKQSKELIWRTINSISNLNFKTNILIVSESQEILDEFKNTHVFTMLRPSNLANLSTPFEKTIHYAHHFFNNELVMILHWNCPFRTSEHIEEAIHTLKIFDADSVVSVSEQNGVFYKNTAYGLRPLIKKRFMRYENKNEFYKENGAIFLTKRRFIKKKSFLGKKVSHILMDDQESFQLDNNFYIEIFENLK